MNCTTCFQLLFMNLIAFEVLKIYFLTCIDKLMNIIMYLIGIGNCFMKGRNDHLEDSKEEDA